MKNSVILVGDGGSSQGSGFLVSHGSKKFIVTACHVTKALVKPSEAWALPHPRQTFFPEGGYSGIKIKKITEYNDDIAVCGMSGLPGSGDKDLIIKTKPGWRITKTITGEGLENLSYIDIEKDIYTGDFSAGDAVQCLGYPVDVIVPLLAQYKDIPLPPFVVNGIITNKDIEKLKKWGCPELICPLVKVMKPDTPIDTSGASGGLIIYNNLFAGILTGGITNKNKSYHDILFTPAKLVRDKILTFKQAI